MGLSSPFVAATHSPVERAREIKRASMAREKDIESRRGRSSKRSRNRSSSPSSSSSSYSSSSSESPTPQSRKSKSKHKKSSRSNSHGDSHRSSKRSRSSRRRDERKRKRRSRKRDSDDDSSDYSSRDEDCDKVEKKVLEANEIVISILEEFPSLASQLHQILEMIDNGQGVDLSGISDKSLAKILKKLFISLKLEKNRKGVYMLAPKSVPVLDIVGPVLIQWMQNSQINNEEIKNDENEEIKNEVEEKEVEAPSPPKRRIIGPAMPSRELLEAAAELTQANDLLREAEIEEDGVLIGPPPPALVAEAESANEAERFEEVTRIMGADANSPYDILGINWKMAPENMKKKYWKLSLLVHPDKCSHPHAKEAFVILNKAFKDLQDPNKRGAIDDKLRAKEEQEKFEVELKSMREAAQWRKIQGITMEGDEELLSVFNPKEEPKRDEWMTSLPPERKAGMTMHSATSFSRTTKEGRGDTSAWTDTPVDKANKAKQNYLEAYDRAKAIAEAEEDKKETKPGVDASLVDKYTSNKRSLVEKHLEEKRKNSKKEKNKQKLERERFRERGKEREKEEWEGNHPWKPWDREKDLNAGRQNVNFDPKDMSKGLGSRFSAGATQRNFL